MSARLPLILGLSLILVFLILFGYSTYRPIDGDEGFYTVASQLTFEGRTPHIDYFFTQAPALPYVYGGYLSWVPPSLLGLRSLSVIFSMLLVILWSGFIYKEYRNQPLIVIFTLLIMLLNPYFYSWGVVVKTYALSNLLISIVFLLLYEALQNPKPVYFFLAGFCFSFCAQVRLLYSLVGFCLFFWILGFPQKQLKFTLNIKASLIFISGVLISLIPIVVLYHKHQDVFLFNILEYHLLRKATPPVWEHGRYILSFLKKVFSLQYLLVQTLLGFVGFYALLKRKDFQNQDPQRPWLYLVFSSLITFLGSSALPYPLHQQYFTAPLMPFYLPFIAYGVGFILTKRNGDKFCLLLIIVGLIFVVPHTTRESLRNSERDVWKISEYNRVSQYLKTHSSRKDRILSFWPGYQFEAQRNYYPGTENSFGIRVAGKLAYDLAESYHLLTKERIFELVHNQVPTIVLVGAWMKEFHNTLSMREYQNFYKNLDQHYQLQQSFGEVKFYVRRNLSIPFRL
ncbi:hypothetical protein WDW89_08990 [Deltaproteobacteria bacterium TL4]